MPEKTDADTFRVGHKTSPRWSIAAFTATRAEYGLLRNTLRLIRDDADLALHLIVGGTHLTEAHGMTINEILSDGFETNIRVPMFATSNDGYSLINAMTQCLVGVGKALSDLKPDLLLLLGDRYELLPVASAATVMRIPIAHIGGGDVTEGAIDNQIRHALTKLAHLHLAGTREAADRIVQMGEHPSRVIVTGQPGLDEFANAPAQDRVELAAELGLDPGKDWVLFTYHPETMAAEGVDTARVKGALDVLFRHGDLQTVLTASNADHGGDLLNAILQVRASAEPARFLYVPSLGHSRFIAMMREASCIVGNSSAGIIQAASVPVPVINFGKRQYGRLMPANVMSIDGDQSSFEAALVIVREAAFHHRIKGMKNPYGEGNAAIKIFDAVERFLNSDSIEKGFCDLACSDAI